MKESPANNTYLSDNELNSFKARLLTLKKETESLIDELKERLNELRKNADDTQSAQDHHQGDLASNEAEKKTVFQALENANEKLDQILIALDRIETGDYGICIETGQQIQKGRLEAMPYAIRSVGIKK